MEAGYKLQGKYVIERLLGRGGMGAVYLAHQVALGKKQVAIKQMEVTVRDAAERARVVEAFQREARLLATLEHPSLVTVYDYFEEGDNHFLVMTYVDGKTLEEIYVERAGDLNIEQVLAWIEQVCEVLEYLHARNPPVIYRDLKPSNIMVDSRNRVWLLDFGIAKVAEPDSKTSTLIKGAGTLGYAPVEQFGHASTDARSDVYSLGATLYSMVTGSQPPVSVDLMLNDARLIPPSSINPEVTPDVETVVFKMMALRKDERYQTMRDAHSALSHATRKLHDARKRKAMREAPGALKLRFVTPENKRPFSDPVEALMQGAPPPGGANTVVGTTPAALPAYQGAPNQTAQTPLWVQQIEESNEQARGLPWYRQPHAVWYVYLVLAVALIALALPTFAGLRSLGIAPAFNYLFYSLGTAVSHAVSNETVRRVSGLVGEFGIPLAVGWFFYSREDFFPALLSAYFIAQGMGDLGLDLRFARLNGYGPASDLYGLLYSSDPTMSANTSTGLLIGGRILTFLVIVLMARWLYHYRPRPRVVVVR